MKRPSRPLIITEDNVDEFLEKELKGECYEMPLNELEKSLEHSKQVRKLSERLFIGLQPLHKLSEKYLSIVSTGAQLHDVGWVYGQKAHHKESCEIIMNYAHSKEFIPKEGQSRNVDNYTIKLLNQVLKSNLKNLTKKEITLVALLARYHRKSLPNKEHVFFKKLDKKDKEIVLKLAAIVRMADGLDFSHGAVIKRLDIEIDNEIVTLHADCLREKTKRIYSGQAEELRIQKKKDLFELAYKKRLETHFY